MRISGGQGWGKVQPKRVMSYLSPDMHWSAKLILSYPNKKFISGLVVCTASDAQGTLTLESQIWEGRQNEDQTDI